MTQLTIAGKKRKHEEQDEQIKLVVWLKKRGILHQASGNGVHCSRLERMKLARMGVSKGFPDILIPIARKGSNSLYIELKKKVGGLLSDEQRYWIERLNLEGNKAVRCNGADEAKQIVTEYLDLNNGDVKNGK
jgi:hypothetical protein